MKREKKVKKRGIISTCISLFQSVFNQELPIPFAIEKESMRGAGVRYKNKKYITHTTLPHTISALITFYPSQKLFIAAVIFILGSGFLINPLLTIQIVLGILSIVYFLDVVFNIFIITKSLNTSSEITFKDEELLSLENLDLPIYTILCPLFRELEVVPQFVGALEKLDWPKDKLDVLILLEGDDNITIDEIKHMKLPEYVRLIIVPNSAPKTKPKACNYGLSFAKGEYVVIYDAEDIPEPSQLKKAYYAFQRVSPDVKCLQAKLSYYNPHQNLLTRLFTAEYSLWFDVTLTGLQTLNTAIPLGGTSNHFHTRDLMQLKGWDPFNVTEDADLGVRLFKQGYKTAIIDSTTLEEANSRLKNWIRQRSRWMKGYMQTYLVHNRDFWSFLKKFRIHALLFHINIGWKISFALINPVLWMVTLSYFLFRPIAGPVIEAMYPAPIYYMAALSLALGNFMFLYLYMVGCAKREQWELVKYAFFVPFYWVMWSTAGFVAVYQLLVKPHYWEKTIHGFHISPTAGRIPAYAPVYAPGSTSSHDPQVLRPGITVDLSVTQPDSSKNGGSASLHNPVDQPTSFSSLFSSQVQLIGFLFALFSVLILFIDNAVNVSLPPVASIVGPLSVLLLFLYTILAPLAQMKGSKKLSMRVHIISVAAFALATIYTILTLHTHTFPMLNMVSFTIIEMIGLSMLVWLFLSNTFSDQNALFEGKKFGRSDNRLNILIFNWRDTKHIWAGGAERYIQELAKRWVKEGNSVTIFCSNDLHNKANETIDGVNIVRRGGIFSVYLAAMIHYIFKFRGEYDVVIDCENGIPFFTPLFVRKPIFLLIFHVHQEVIRQHLWFPLSTILELLETRLMPLVYRDQSIVTISKSSRKDIQKLGFKRTKSSIDIVYCGADSHKVDDIKKTDHPSFVYLGRLKPYKRIDIAIQSFKKILTEYPNAQLSIAGYGEALSELRKLTHKLGIVGSVNFLGRVSEEEKWRLLAESWVTLQPSQIEGWGITVIESNACGTPVIASDVSGLCDSVVDGRTGVLVKAGSTREMAAAMKTIIKDTEFRQFLSVQAYQWSCNFNWDASAQSFMTLIYQRIVATRTALESQNISLNSAIK